MYEYMYFTLTPTYLTLTLLLYPNLPYLTFLLAFLPVIPN